MAWYKSGSVNVTNGNATVYGNGTLWVDVSILYPGDVWVGPDARLYEILSIQSNTQLTLASTYLGATANAQTYAVMPIGLLPAALAQQVKTTLSTANTALSQAVRFDANQNLTSGQKATARTNIGATTASDVGLGLLSKSVAGGVDVTLSTDEAANLFYEFTGALTANINVVVPGNVRQFFVRNATTGAFTLTVKTAAGSGIKVLQGTRTHLECDGTNVLDPTSEGSAVAVDANGNVGIGTSAPTQALDVRNATGGNITAGRTVNVGTNSEPGNFLTTAPNGSGNSRVWSQLRTVVGTATEGSEASSLIIQTQKAGALTEVARFDVQGNLGQGAAPTSTWWSSVRVHEFGRAGNAVFAGVSDDEIDIGANVVMTGSGTYAYGVADTASLYRQVAGQHVWYRAAAGTAGAALTLTEVLRTNTNNELELSASEAYINFRSTAGVGNNIRSRIRSVGSVAGSGYGGSFEVSTRTPTNTWNDGALIVDTNGYFFVGVSTSTGFGGRHRISSTQAEGATIMAVDGGTQVSALFCAAGQAGYSNTSTAVLVGKNSTTTRSINAGGTVNASGADYAEYMTKADGCGAIAKGEIVGIDVDGKITDKWASAVSFMIKSTDPSYVGGDVWGNEESLGIQRPVDEDSPTYEAELAAFEMKLEAARQRVDRIAYCGQVPVNVQGAAPGQYVVPVQDGDGIAGILVDDGDITFAQYRRAVGRVLNILPDGRPNVAVKIV